MGEDTASSDTNETVSMIKANLKALWEGKVPLFTVFWIYYVGIVFVLKALSFIIFGSLFNLISVLWAGFLVKPIFTSADKYEGNSLWALLAKVAAVCIAIGVIRDLVA